MALTSASTVTDAIAQYNDNLAWWTSASKAENLLEAVLYLLGNRGWEIETNGHRLKYESLVALRDKLAAKVQATSSAANSRRCSFTRGRPTP